MKIYFAHPVSHYGTGYEKQCLEVIQKQFPDAEILNPAGDEHTALYKAQGFNYFHRLVAGCDVVVAACYKDLVWGMGVFKEALGAYDDHKDVYVVYQPAIEGAEPKIEQLTKEDIERIRPLSILETRARTKGIVL